MRWLIFTFLIAFLPGLYSQEIKCTVSVTAPGVQMTNKQILTTLQTSIEQFINNRKWTEDNFENREKIEISMVFTVTSVTQDNDFQSTLQITSTRPVFNSTYKTSVFKFNDKDVVFKYREFESLDYTDGQNTHDLTSLLAFYSYFVLGYDYDSFGELGGSAYFTKAQAIVSLMTGKTGWGQTDGEGIRNRYFLSENINNTRFQVVRKLNYSYHRKGMDHFYENPDEARATITESLKTLQELVSSYGSGSLLQRTFFTTKNTELVDIYKGATVPEKNSILELLAQLDPTNAPKYQEIKK
ncbi:MAG: DUF4835 family protein [Bacteroidetes bacterium]|nr:DUF4835 family protein [Bacteroidota bacterium]